MRIPLPELLAPAGSPEALAAVLEAGADSVYLAGKRFAMRQHAAWLNFDDAGLAAAIAFAHRRGKRVYLALNNLLTDYELDRTDAFLDSVEVWGPDALIIQDLGLLHRLRRRGLAVQVHASCMMNVHNLAGARMLGRLGVSRIIASRDISLADAARLQRDSGLEFEYFLHGDMCIAQSGQCVTSGILAGESSSRGRCLKPCRWSWELVEACGEPVSRDSGLLLARKDLCLLQHVPTLVQSGITALKIEGRARRPDYLARIVRAYRRALEAYAADPVGYTPDAEMLEGLRAHRVRDFSTCLTFGNPGRESIGKDGAREPAIFSVVIEQAALDGDPPVTSGAECRGAVPELVVHCSSAEAAEAALAAGAQGICLGGERWRRNGSVLTGADVAAIARAASRAGAALYGAAPRISETAELTDGAFSPFDPRIFEGYYVHSLGQLHTARKFGLPVIADLGFNLFNAEAFALLAELGAVRGVASLELGLSQISQMAPLVSGPMEFVIHGPVVGMISEHCLVRAACDCDAEARESSRPPCLPGMVLRDVAGQEHAVLTDARCRNHILLPRHLCVLPVLDELMALGPAALRIDGRHEAPAVLREIVEVYRTAMDRLADGRDPPADSMQRLVRCAPTGLSLGAYGLRVADIALPGEGLPTNEWVRPQSVRCTGEPAVV